MILTGKKCFLVFCRNFFRSGKVETSTVSHFMHRSSLHHSTVLFSKHEISFKKQTLSDPLMGEQFLLRGEAEIPCFTFAQILYYPGRHFLNACGGVQKVRFGLNFCLLSLVTWEKRSQTLYLSFYSVVSPAILPRP